MSNRTDTVDGDQGSPGIQFPPLHGDTRRSAAATAYRRWYKTAKWRRLRAAQLERHPLCQCPHCDEGRKRLTVATVVDHTEAPKGRRHLFFDPSNLRSMGKQCHDSFKQSQERGGHGFDKGCDEHGWPLT